MIESLSFWVVRGDSDNNLSLHTQRLSHEQVERQGTSALQREKLLGFLQRHPEGLSNQDLEQALGMRISSVTARINELRREGLIKIGGARINPVSEKLNTFWVVS